MSDLVVMYQAVPKVVIQYRAVPEGYYSGWKVVGVYAVPFSHLRVFIEGDLKKGESPRHREQPEPAQQPPTAGVRMKRPVLQYFAHQGHESLARPRVLHRALLRLARPRQRRLRVLRRPHHPLRPNAREFANALNRLNNLPIQG